MVHAGSSQGAFLLLLWVEGINCGGQEIMKDLEAFEFW